MCADNNSCVDKAELLQLVKTVVYASDEGVFISPNMTSSQWEDDWDLAHSMYFIATTLTTIGSSAWIEITDILFSYKKKQRSTFFFSANMIRQLTKNSCLSDVLRIGNKAPKRLMLTTTRCSIITGPPSC